MMRVELIDQVPLVGSREKTADGYLMAKAAVTRNTVSRYTRGELGLDGDPTDTVGVLRTADTVFHEDTAEALRLRPVTIGHPEDGVSPEKARNLSVGATGEITSKDDDALIVGIAIHDQDAIDLVEAGTDKVSLGYAWDLEEQSGEFNGESYDYVSDGPMLTNHLAIVPQGRVEGARVMDEKEGTMRVLLSSTAGDNGVINNYTDVSYTVDANGKFKFNIPEGWEIPESGITITATDNSVTVPADQPDQPSTRTKDAYVSAEVILNLFDSFFIDGEGMSEEITRKITEMVQGALSADGALIADAKPEEMAKSIAKLVSEDVDRMAGEMAVKLAKDRANVLIIARDVMDEEEFEKIRDGSIKDILVVAVGDSVPNPEDQSVDFLKAALHFVAKDGVNSEGRKRAADQQKNQKGDKVNTDGTNKAFDAYAARTSRLQKAHRAEVN